MATPTPPTIHLPGCKSLSQRALLLAASATGRSDLRGVSDCDDSRLLRQCLAALGVGFQAGAEGLQVEGLGGPPQVDEVRLDVGEAGSSLRFLLPWCAAGRGRFVITGSERLLSRPQQPLLQVLTALGARIEPTEVDGRPGYRLDAQGLPAGRWPCPLGASSQYLSGLVLAAGWSDEVHLDLPSAIPSRAYFDLTLAAIRAFRGVEAVVEESATVGHRLRLQPGHPAGRSFPIPADPSAATFFAVAAFLLDRPLRLTPAWTLGHPEADLLEELDGHGLIEVGELICPAADTPTEAVVLDLDSAPDAGPALAVLGCALPSGLDLHGIARLRHKESDRVVGMQRLVALCGGDSVVEGERIRIRPGRGQSAPRSFDPDQDHRLAMAAAIADLRWPGVEVLDRGCVTKSFPDFWQQRQCLLSG